MPKPNFFIIGAPKCGTTSLLNYLGGHKDVCVSVPKEPHYFLTDLPSYRQVKDLSSYEACFKCGARTPARVGEASTWYLYSMEAVRNILEYNHDSKIIVMIRNPVEMAVSLHQQFVYGYEEDRLSLEEAWYLQERRRKGECVPNGILEPSRLQYFEVCSLGSQLSKIKELVPDSQLKIILFDNLSSDVKKVYCEVLEFLDLPDDGRDNFPIQNKRKMHRSIYVDRFMRSNKNINQWVRLIKSILGIKNIGISKHINRINMKCVKKAELDAEFKKYLIGEFSSEITKIEKLLNVDLEHWRN